MRREGFEEAAADVQGSPSAEEIGEGRRRFKKKQQDLYNAKREEGHGSN